MRASGLRCRSRNRRGQESRAGVAEDEQPRIIEFERPEKPSSALLIASSLPLASSVAIDVSTRRCSTRCRQVAAVP